MGKADFNKALLRFFYNILIGRYLIVETLEATVFVRFRAACYLPK